MKSLREITHDRLDDARHLQQMAPKEGAAQREIDTMLTNMQKEGEYLIDRVIKSFGNCEKCYGKGYGTATEYMQSFPDFGDEPTFDEKMPVMRFCTCDRGQQLRKLVSAGKVAP